MEFSHLFILQLRPLPYGPEPPYSAHDKNFFISFDFVFLLHPLTFLHASAAPPN